MHYNKDMLRIAQMEEGEKIYHYTTIDALINIVSRKELWVTKWDYLNDMDELTVAEDVCAVVLREENVKSEVIQDVKKYINIMLMNPHLILKQLYVKKCHLK